MSDERVFGPETCSQQKNRSRVLAKELIGEVETTVLDWKKRIKKKIPLTPQFRIKIPFLKLLLDG